MRFREQLKDLLQKDGVLKTGYNLSELKDEVDNREQVLDKLEQKAESEYRKEKRCLEKKKDAVGRRRERYAKKARIHERRRRVYEKFHERLMKQQILLTNLVAHAREKQILENPKQELGLEIDLKEMDTRKVARAVEDSQIEADPVDDGLQDISDALAFSNPDTVTEEDREADDYEMDHDLDDDLENLIDEEIMQHEETSRDRDTDANPS